MCKRYLLSILVAIGIGILVIIGIGTILSKPYKSEIGAPPSELNALNVQFLSNTGRPVFGWYLPGKELKASILLLHGVRSDRRQMINRAKFLNHAGFAVLLFDFQAHGESPGNQITYGFLEAKDTEAAFSYLKSRHPGKNIGIIGASLGGAAAVLCNVCQNADAMVLEAVFPTLEKAIINRITQRLGPTGRHLAPLLLWQIKPRLGFNPKIIAPIDHLATAKIPLLVIAGTEDKHTLLEDSRQLFDAASDPKQLWVIEGAAHTDFYHFAPAQYQQTILEFLRRYL